MKKIIVGSLFFVIGFVNCAEQPLATVPAKIAGSQKNDRGEDWLKIQKLHLQIESSEVYKKMQKTSGDILSFTGFLVAKESGYYRESNNFDLAFDSLVKANCDLRKFTQELKETPQNRQLNEILSKHQPSVTDFVNCTEQPSATNSLFVSLIDYIWEFVEFEKSRYEDWVEIKDLMGQLQGVQEKIIAKAWSIRQYMEHLAKEQQLRPEDEKSEKFNNLFDEFIKASYDLMLLEQEIKKMEPNRRFDKILLKYQQ
jgi:hypothetical protein